MPAFVLELDADTREELYSDVSEVFMGFILIEALFNILKAGVNNVTQLLDDLDNLIEAAEEDPYKPIADRLELQMEHSLEYLLDVQRRSDEELGMMLDKSYYAYNSDHYTNIQFKLITAIQSIEESNDYFQLQSLNKVFQDPDLVNGFGFSMTHYLDRVVVLVFPKGSMMAGISPSVGLADLLGGGNPEGNLNMGSVDNDIFLQMTESSAISAMLKAM